MPKAILLCGKICSGKTTYAQALQKAQPRSVALSCDALMLALFPDGAREQHDMLAERARRYLFALSLDILNSGADVILDWGFWTRAWRDEARGFYERHGVGCETHYIDVSPEVWRRHIGNRNAAVRCEMETAYFLDNGLLTKAESLFEPPEDDEIDVLYQPD